MENTQITLDDLVTSYKNEISTLIHNKIITGIQVEKLSTQLESLIIENKQLNEKISQLESKITKRTSKATSDSNYE